MADGQTMDGQTGVVTGVTLRQGGSGYSPEPARSRGQRLLSWSVPCSAAVSSPAPHFMVEYFWTLLARSAPARL